MTTDFLKQAALFIIFILAQSMVLGRIHLFGFATPLLCIYFVLMFQRNLPKWSSLLWSFMMGLLIDIFTNTPGLTSASLTFIAAIQPYFLELFISRDAAEDLRPAFSTIGPGKYAYYASVLVLLFCVVFYSLEFFSFYDWTRWILNVVGSSVITLVLIFTFETAKIRK